MAVPALAVPTNGFLANPNFELGSQYWKYAASSGTLRNDPVLGRNVMVLKRGKILRQNILPRVVLGQPYQFGFWTSITGVSKIDFRVIMRLRFKNTAAPNGPCRRAVCNFNKRALAKRIGSAGGQWQQVVTPKFDLPWNYTAWPGEIDFILFQLLAKNLNNAGEFSVANFEMIGDEYTDAPSSSMAPSNSPTNLVQTHLGYVVRYAGEVRTVVRAPFQIDKTGEVLQMTPGKEYRLCEVDEVEGRKAEVRRDCSSFVHRSIPQQCLTSPFRS
jgi:hypothetical protein